MDAELHDTVADRLRRDRQRYTSGRRDLVALLAEAGRPLTIVELLAADSGLSQSSLYRNLQVLELAGVVRRVVTPGDAGTRYELAEHLTSHHHHLVCTVCGSVEDFAATPPLERALEDLTREVSGREGFDTHGHRLDLVGVCDSCGGASGGS